MFAFLKRSPKPCDEAFIDLSHMLLQHDERPTYMRDRLDSAKLDFSLESLKHLDEYLSLVHENQPPEDDLVPVVLRCGAYLGEVIRKNAGQGHHWYDFKQAAKLSAFVKSLGMSLGTAAVLAVDGDNVCFPLAKIMKFIENGPGDATYAFGYMGINGPPE